MPRSREELVEALELMRDLAAPGLSYAQQQDVLTEACDLLDSLEDGYRVVGDEGPLREGVGVKLTDPNTLAVAERWADPEHWPASYKNIRIQRHAESPWTDVEEGTDGR